MSFPFSRRFCMLMLFFVRRPSESNGKATRRFRSSGASSPPRDRLGYYQSDLITPQLRVQRLFVLAHGFFTDAQLLEAFIPNHGCLLNLSVALSIEEIHVWVGRRNKIVSMSVSRCARWYDIRESCAHIVLSHSAPVLHCCIILKTAKIHFVTQKVRH